MMQKLDVELKDEKVKKALYDMDPWKSPGSDGYPVGFYQNSWSIVGSKVCTHVRRFWDNPKEIAEVNYINLCLIPKTKQCLSLCNLDNPYCEDCTNLEESSIRALRDCDLVKHVWMELVG
ncbi:hypothetical protein KIW84_075816 [Lathyrus oleraceus]|uniref:Uncharacterized protein n=1 Tax=Pisum sativum TaxID=3888 RepID=A0A9D4VUP0_PEA|nr:hypothetical protein KIW84_075816 [Pisum sativum]